MGDTVNIDGAFPFSDLVSELSGVQGKKWTFLNSQSASKSQRKFTCATLTLIIIVLPRGLGRPLFLVAPLLKGYAMHML